MMWVAGIAVAAVMAAQSAAADVCVPGATLVLPHIEVADWIGLSVVVDARRHPGMALEGGVSIGETSAALEATFEDMFGDEPERVQDLRKIGAFVQVFRMSSGTPLASYALFDPEFVIPLIPVLERNGISTGAEALTTVWRSFLDFETLAEDDLIGAMVTSSVVRFWDDSTHFEAADALLVASVEEVETALVRMMAEDASVGYVMADRRERLSDEARLQYLMERIDRCLEARDLWSVDADTLAALPEVPRTLVMLDLLVSAFDHPVSFLEEHGQIIPEALRVMDATGLEDHHATLTAMMDLFPLGVIADEVTWSNMVWAQESAIIDIRWELLERPLSRVQDPEYEVWFGAPVQAAAIAYAQQSDLWPVDP